ncbi:hypothetical protein JTB14_009016 [Gonioctena quinquepunctata]|nr:hypothetical protein JTB14_009016 [Gonioctena quinquepunctata]
MVYLHIPKELPNENFSRSPRIVLSNGYRLWCHENEKLSFGKDVVYDEIKFANQTDDFYETVEENITSKNIPDLEVNDDASQDKNDENTKILRRSTRKMIRPKYLEDYALIALNAETFLNNVL